MKLFLERKKKFRFHTKNHVKHVKVQEAKTNPKQRVKSVKEKVKSSIDKGS